MPDSDTLIREQCEPHLQRLAELVYGKFEATTGGGNAGLLAYVADRLEEAQELLEDVRCSGVEHTNPGRYHTVQICMATWQQIDDFAACE